MQAVDTNIIIYSNDPRDPAKQLNAVELIENLSDGVLIWQVVCEYLSASRKLEPFGWGFEQALANVNDMREIWDAYFPTWDMYDRAIHLKSQYSISIWDALIVAACLEAGVDTLYSEDINDDYKKEGLTIINPFK